MHIIQPPTPKVWSQFGRNALSICNKKKNMASRGCGAFLPYMAIVETLKTLSSESVRMIF